MNHGGTQASLDQRRANVAAIAERKRAKQTCKRGHNNWRIRKDTGARVCRTCDNDRHWYWERGLKLL